MPSKRKRPTPTQSDLLREVRELRTLANATAMLVDVTRRDFEERCDQLQSEIDSLKKLFLPLN